MQAELEALGARSSIPSGPWSRSSAAPRSRPSSTCSATWSPGRPPDHRGAMANTFIHAAGGEVGASLCEKDLADTARTIKATAEARGCAIVLPVDGVVAEKIRGQRASTSAPADKIPPGRMMLGRRPAEHGAVRPAHRRRAHHRVERPGRRVRDHAVRRRHQRGRQGRRRGRRKGARSASPAAATRSRPSRTPGVTEKMTYVSTAGGAFLEWLEGKRAARRRRAQGARPSADIPSPIGRGCRAQRGGLRGSIARCPVHGSVSGASPHPRAARAPSPDGRGNGLLRRRLFGPRQ